MPLTSCRECGNQVSSEAATCPHCGITHPARFHTQSKRHSASRDRTLLAGWICFGIGMLAMIFTLPLPLISAPLFFAAFVVAIVVIVRGRAWAGIGLLLTTAIVPAVVFFAVLYLGISSWANELEEAVPASEAKAQLRVEGVSARRSGSFMYCSGSVRNAGSKRVNALLIITEWRDRSGEVLATGRVFAGSIMDTLGPGESADFEAQYPNDPAMSDCQAKVYAGS